MEDKEETDQEYRLRIRSHPWQAILEIFPAPNQYVTSSEYFNSPLELLERLEKDAHSRRGLK